MCIIGHAPSFSQDTSETSKSKYSFTPHSYGVSTRYGGAGIYTYPTSDFQHTFLYTTTFDFYINTGKTKNLVVRPLIQVRLSTPFAQTNTSYPFLDEFRWGMLFGGYGYVFDYRSSEGLGWSMLGNGGILLDFPTIERITDSPDQSVMVLGGEIDFKAIYNFAKNTGVTFGINIGYSVSYTSHTKLSIGDDGFVIATPIGLYLENAIVYGMNIGIIF